MSNTQHSFEITRPIYRKIGTHLLRLRFFLLFILASVTLYVGPKLTELKIGNSVEGMMPKGDPELAHYNDLKNEFGGENFLFIAFETPNIFDPKVLEKIRGLTLRLENVENVEKVFSLTNYKDLITRKDPETQEEILESVPIVPEVIPQDPVEIEKLRAKVLNEPNMVGNLVSKDAKITAIILQTRDWTLEVGVEGKETADNLVDKRLTQAIQAVLTEEGMSYAHIAGMSFVRSKMSEYIVEDFKRFLLPTLCFMLILLAAIFRTFTGIVLPILSVGMCLIWTLSLIAFSGQTLTIVSSMLPPLVLVSTIGDSIHIISEFYENAHHIPDKRELSLKTFSYVVAPCFLTTITTMFGYFSNFTAPIQPVRDFGLFAAIGVGIAYIITILFVPIVLYLSKHPQHKKHTGAQTDQGFRLYKVILKSIEKLNLRYRQAVFWSAILVMMGIGSGIFYIKVDTNFVSYFYENSPVRQGFDFIEGNLAGVNSLDVDIVVKEEGLLKEPEVLRKIEKLQAFLLADASDAIGHVFSVVDIVKMIHQAMNEDQIEFYSIPDSRQAVAQFLLLLSAAGEQETLDSWVDFTYTRAKVAARVNTIGSSDMVKLTQRVRDYVDREFNDDRVTGHVTGQAVLFANLVHLLIVSQYQSIAFAFFLVGICMTIVFRSLILGAISMIPNLIPIVITLGLMGWTGITLNVATVMISCIALGIAVDGTTHYFTRFKREYQIDQNYDQAMSRALHGVGPALAFTNIIVIIGFGIPMISNFKLTFYFSLLLSMTMFSALWGDLIVGPVSLIYLRPKIRREVFNYDS